MKFLHIVTISLLLVLVSSNVIVSFESDDDLIRPSVETNWYCRASSFPQYLDSLMIDDTFPEECVTPAIDIFSDIDVIYIEEKDESTWNYPDYMNVTGVDSLLIAMNAYGKRSTPVKKICYNEDSKYCPSGFLLVNNITDVEGMNKTVIYRPLHANSTAVDDLVELGDKKILILYALSSNEEVLTESAIVDRNIVFVVVIILVLLGAATVFAVATIDYGEDTAGLYSKYKQDKSQ